jgi:hypothetical protein
VHNTSSDGAWRRQNPKRLTRREAGAQSYGPLKEVAELPSGSSDSNGKEGASHGEGVLPADGPHWRAKTLTLEEALTERIQIVARHPEDNGKSL